MTADRDKREEFVIARTNLILDILEGQLEKGNEATVIIGGVDEIGRPIAQSGTTIERRSGGSATRLLTPEELRP